MTSFLILTDRQNEGLQKAVTLCDEKHISPFDTTVFALEEYETKTGQKKSWGIADIKEIQKKIYLKPLRGEWKAVILKDAQLLTSEAQNGLLKLLEEPPNGTLLILITDSLSDLLPTIRSRCSIITLQKRMTISETEKEEMITEVQELLTSPLGTRLKKAEALSKNKETALSWLKKALIAEHMMLGDNPDPEASDRIRALHTGYTVIKASNVPIRLVLENLFLRVSK
jgi:hypothetical protein